MSSKRIGLKEVRSLGAHETIWDGAVAGFGARRQKSDAISYVLKFRTTAGRQRYLTIGRHGAPWTPDAAREEAKRLLGSVVVGEDPSDEKVTKRHGASVAQLCDHYLSDAEAGRLLTRRKAAKKASTLATDKGRIERHIKPLLGTMKVASITRDDIEDFMHAIADGKTAMRARTAKKRGVSRVTGGKGTATRTVGLLGAIFTYAVRHKLRVDNPVYGVIRFADGRRKRRLSEEEYALLGNALLKAEKRNIWPPALAVAKFLALTGWRSGEALALRWDQVDEARRTAILSDTKTGHSMRPISTAACSVITSLHRRAGGTLVFPASRGPGPMTGFPKFWAKIALLENLSPDVTPHTLRHSFASLGADLGYSEPTIAALIGHKGTSITSRYVHSADAVLLSAADTIAEKTLELIGAKTAKNEA